MTHDERDPYDDAVGDGTTVVQKPDETARVTESNASNYGASAVETPAELEERIEREH